MTTLFNQQGNDLHAASYWADLESAMMAKTIAQATTLPPDRQKALLRTWMHGSFNARAYGLEPELEHDGMLSWTGEGTLRSLIYHSPTGIACHLGRVYQQPDGSWAALVIAGVGEDEYDAMARAEWAIARLTGGE